MSLAHTRVAAQFARTMSAVTPKYAQRVGCWSRDPPLGGRGCSVCDSRFLLQGADLRLEYIYLLIKYIPEFRQGCRVCCSVTPARAISVCPISLVEGSAVVARLACHRRESAVRLFQ